MSKLFVYFVVLLFSVAWCQEVNRVRLVNHKLYMHDVVRKVVDELDKVEWSTLKLPEFLQQVDELILENNITGTLNYTNGFVVSIQDLEIIESSIQQKWYSQSADSGEVEVLATLRLKEVGLGYDIISHFENANGRYTALVTVPEITVAFSVFNDLFADIFANVTVKASTAKPLISVLPINAKTDMIQALFDSSSITDYLPNWGEDVFKPITLDVIYEVPFPTICYNCPVS